MTEQQILDALAGSGIDDDTYSEVAAAVRALAASSTAGIDLAQEVISHEHLLPNTVLSRALHAVELSAPPLPVAA